jgi:hypothetical protein
MTATGPNITAKNSDASVGSFVGAFRKQWFAAMSGGLSVPFALLSVLLDSKWAQVIFGTLAFCGVWFAAYRMWKIEREENVAFKELVRPKIEFVGLNRHDDTGFEIEIRNAGSEHLSNCLVKIENAEVTAGSAISSTHLPMTLITRGQQRRGDTGSFNLRPGEIKPLSFIYRANMPSGWPALDYEGGSRIFSNVTQCTFTLVAFGPPTPSRAKVIVDLDADTQLTARMILDHP